MDDDQRPNRIPRERAWKDFDGNPLDTAEKLAAHYQWLNQVRSDPALNAQFWTDVEARDRRRRAQPRPPSVV